MDADACHWQAEALDVAASRALAAQLAQAFVQSGAKAITTHWQGDLGAGKTAWVRWLLQSLCVSEAVRSPSFALAQSYVLGAAAGRLAGKEFWHLDLYRMTEARELREAGLLELFDGSQWLCVEWPERAAGLLPSPDLLATLKVQADEQRELSLHASSENGKQVLRQLASLLQTAQTNTSNSAPPATSNPSVDHATLKPRDTAC